MEEIDMEKVEIHSQGYDLKLIQRLKQSKIAKWIISFIVIILVVIGIHFSFYFGIKSLVHSNKSINPQSTEYFIQANTISTLWINIAHNYLFVDYDSPIMKPLLDITDYYFNKGEKSINSNNAEDAVWWFLTYAYVYNINTSDRDDNSMDIYLLPKDREIKLRYKLADYVVKLGNNGVKGVGFGKYESSAMHAMFAVSFSKIDIDKHYIGKTKQDRVNHYWKDKKLYDYRVQTYNAYIKFLKNDKYKDGWELYSLNSLNSRLTYLIKKELEIFDNKYIMNCNNVFINDFIENLNYLILSISRNENNKPYQLAKNRLVRQKSDIFVLKKIEQLCPKFKIKAKEVKQQLNQIKGK